MMKPERKIKARDFNRQPGWFKAVNKVWKTTYSLGSKPNLDKDNLIRAAKKATGLNDLGKDFNDEPLEKLLYSIREEASLHPLGYFITRQRLVNMLAVRLRAEDYFKKHPEILEQPLYPVMLVIGLQRTGTTKLQRLLAADPDNRALLSWEAINPAPIDGDVKNGEKRIKIARTSEKALKFISPAFFAIHPVEHLAPEEDVLLLDISFMSQTPEATMHVPSYSAWLEKTDMSPAYAYMVKLLKLLQWQRPGKSWVLKTPNHLEFLDLTKKYFGNLQYIWLHRDIYESIPSFLSMVSYSRAIFSNRVDPHQVAEHWVRKNGVMLEKALSFMREDNHRALFTHLSYKELVDDALGIIERIYADIGEKISPKLKRLFVEANAKNGQGKYGRHIYSLEDFGIDEKYIDQYTKEYQEFKKTIIEVNEPPSHQFTKELQEDKILV